jgi:RNA:NAD 2'-phosphotransferase (TPT1/KptA family)
MKLFHQTQKKNVASILRDGLKPSRIGIVYLSPRSDLSFGDVTLIVETGDNKLTAFDGCEDWEVLCWGSIPPEHISVITTEVGATNRGGSA